MKSLVVIDSNCNIVDLSFPKTFYKKWEIMLSLRLVLVNYN